ncbi:MAG: Chorismate mutase [Oscillospiraceae bacterium]|nr:Chorismate mutase [Oscillospiraceae bacterium]
MSEMEQLRGRIDEIDEELVRLFEARMAITEQVGAYKAREGLEITDYRREREVLAKKRELLNDPSLSGDLTALFQTMFALSRKQQNRILHGDGNGMACYAKLEAELGRAREPVENPRVLYQGVPGAYSEEAAIRFFGPQAARVPMERWEDVFLVLREGQADYGVLPVENSSTGAVIEVYDLLQKYDAFIVGEQLLKVNHCLLAPAGATLDTITEVYSHSQGLFQCREFLDEHPGWTRNAMPNTAGSAKYVAECGSLEKAAICSARVAELYGLEILREGINFNRENYTRFIVISPRLEHRADCNKISLLFALPHESGSLYKIITVFAEHGLNLLKLESRPIAGRSWEYRFFMDFAGHLDDPGMETVLRQVAECTTEFRVLGNYRAYG